MNPLIHLPKASSGKVLSADKPSSGGSDQATGTGVATNVVSSVVRVRAKFGSRWASPGSGFCIRQWDGYLITARHLVMAANGAGPTDLEIRVGTGQAAQRLHWSGLAFFPRAMDVDVAVVRVRESLASPLEAVSAQDEAKAQIWGYREGRTVLDKFDTRASFKRPWLSLTKSGLPGMSGGPVVFIPSDGSKVDQVIGIYLGLKQHPGGHLRPTAYAVDDDDVERCFHQLQAIA